MSTTSLEILNIELYSILTYISYKKGLILKYVRVIKAYLS